MPHRLRALAANTTKVSVVTAKIAAIESIANITSNAATATSGNVSGDAFAVQRAEHVGQGVEGVSPKTTTPLTNLKIPGGGASHTIPASVPHHPRRPFRRRRLTEARRDRYASQALKPFAARARGAISGATWAQLRTTQQHGCRSTAPNRVPQNGNGRAGGRAAAGWPSASNVPQH